VKGLQKVIKGLAIALAVLIIGAMFSALVGAGVIVGRILDRTERSSADWSEVGDVIDVDDLTGFTELYLDLKATSLRVERGEKLEILSDDAEIKVRRGGNALYITEETSWFDWSHHDGRLKIRLPENTKLDVFDLNGGAGKVEIDGLRADRLNLELGAGRVELQNVVATNVAKIDAGAGYLSLSDAKMRDLDLDMGAGKVEVEAELLGDTKIDAGVGHLVLNLYGREEDYRVKVDKGLGSVKFNGEEMSDGSTRGNGQNVIDIDGGVGAIEITTN